METLELPSFEMSLIILAPRLKRYILLVAGTRVKDTVANIIS